MYSRFACCLSSYDEEMDGDEDKAEREQMLLARDEQVRAPSYLATLLPWWRANPSPPFCSVSCIS